jgi:NAD+ kinase
VPVLQLVPIRPHSLGLRALVFANSEPVTIFPANPTSLVMIAVDGNGGSYVLPDDWCGFSDRPIRLVLFACPRNFST